VLTPASPSPSLDDVYAWEADAILKREGLGRLWGAFGQTYLRSGGPSSYDRELLHWILEGVFELGAIDPALDRLYAAVRYSAIGTFDSDEGWRLRVMNGGANLLFNVRDAQMVTAGLGLRLSRRIRLKSEYTWSYFDLVRGVTSDLESLARHRSYFGFGFALDL
jgi:hypothetical protein